MLMFLAFWIHTVRYSNLFLCVFLQGFFDLVFLNSKADLYSWHVLFWSKKTSFAELSVHVVVGFNGVWFLSAHPKSHTNLLLMTEMCNSITIISPCNEGVYIKLISGLNCWKCWTLENSVKWTCILDLILFINVNIVLEVPKIIFLSVYSVSLIAVYRKSIRIT